MNTIVLYHETSPGIPCPDGHAAAWVAHRALGPDIKIIGCLYQDERLPPKDFKVPPVVPGDRLYILDLSFPAWLLTSWREQGNIITIIDHHKDKIESLLTHPTLAGLITFDEHKCGSLLTWEHFFPDEPVPTFLKYIDDRDRWVKQLPHTEEIHAAYQTYGNFDARQFENYDKLAGMSEEEFIDFMLPIGINALGERRRCTEAACERARLHILSDRWDECSWRQVPILRLEPDELYAHSDIGNLLAQQHPEQPFSALYWREESGLIKWSLRSLEGTGARVSTLAELFGGNGHPNAAGFRITEEEHKQLFY
ncbi:hypothetical protein [Pantanalinema sp. GBBB05]|uniref:hypothetical protein n=1 Tax=Pantanalinema sp. GBBB05 TaxID=2604139 RepID=UPI001DDC9C18|nr:hypothetical protein [Pantanalinema sp. GBBB05]